MQTNFLLVAVALTLFAAHFNAVEGAGKAVVLPILGPGVVYDPVYAPWIIVPPGQEVPMVNMVCGPKNHCYCDGWNDWLGSKNEKMALTVLKWIVTHASSQASTLSTLYSASLAFFGFEFVVATCGWEETFVCCIELIHVCFSIWHMTDSPCMLYLSTGNYALWLRYAEWLLSCPVILIHLSNLTGMKNDYNKRTMALLVSDVGCIVWGITAAFAQNEVKIIFFFMGLTFGMYTFYAAAKIYIEAYHTVPKGVCRHLVKIQAYDYFITWSCFPILFVLGPEGFGHITQYTSGIAHEILDLFSKNLWGILGHLIRVKIHHHILVNGNITKKTKMSVGGEEVEVETYIDGDEANDPESQEDVTDNGTKDLANRHSFVMMKERLQKKGVDVRASLGDGDDMSDMDLKGGMGPKLQPGRVILVVPDSTLVNFFTEQFSFMPAPIEVVPALGPEVGLQLSQQAISIGGPSYVDYVLVHPEYLRDRSPSGLLGRVKMMGLRVCAFGMVPQGPHRELIEACGPTLDGCLEGPSFQAGFNPAQLVQLTARMQSMKGGMNGMNGSMMGGNNGSTMGGNTGSMMGGGGGMNGSMGGMMGGGGGMNGSMGGMMGSNPSMVNNGMNGSMMGSNPSMANNGMNQGMVNNGMNGSMMGMNPLNNPAGNASFRGSLGGVPASLPSQSAPVAPAAAAAPSETEMLTQLMGEINKLKSELGEN
eukprot:gene20346-27109_t